MTRRMTRIRTCTYAVAVDASATRNDIVALASYLSTLGLADCEVLIVDGSPIAMFDANDRVLRWVGRHVAAHQRHRNADGEIDLIRAAVDLASCEKVIIAGTDTRCTGADIAALSALLDQHELVEPDEYVNPTTWWSGIEAGRILVHRGIEQPGQVRTTFALRRSAYRPLLDYEERTGDSHVRRLLHHGVDMTGKRDVFVRREPPQLERWWKQRANDAAADFSLPLKTAFFMILLPMVLLLWTVGGGEAAGGAAGVLAFSSVLLAVKGRMGAGKFFPLYTCLFAPLWVAERSVSVYWALIEKLRGGRVAAPATVAARSDRQIVNR